MAIRSRLRAVLPAVLLLISGRAFAFDDMTVTRIDANSSDMMAFIVSGGVTEIPTLASAASTARPEVTGVAVATSDKVAASSGDADRAS